MTDLTPERLQELRRIAEAATPGPWKWNKYLHLFSATGKPVITKPFSSDNPDVVEAMPEDLDYIERFNPETVLALLDEIERLRREREVLAEAVMGWQRYLERDVGTEIVHVRTLEAHGRALALLNGEKGGDGE